MTGLSGAQKRELAGRARTLRERLDGPPNEPGTTDGPDPDELLESWRELFPGDAEFEDRLEYDGLTEEDLRTHAGRTAWPSSEPLPDWLDTLEALIRAVEGGPYRHREVNRERDHELPFQPILIEISAFARADLLDPGAVERLPSEALDPLVEWLDNRLVDLCSRPLYVEFKTFVKYHDEELATADPDAFEDPPTELYESFVEATFGGGFSNICEEYPVLARALVSVLEGWCGMVEEVAERLARDWGELRERFGFRSERPSVSSVEPLAHDTHAGGRIPVRIELESGGSIVYKPRSVSAGVVFYEILERLEAHLDVPSFRTPTYLERDGYGWMEWIPNEELAGRDAAERYYERAGALACLAYVLELVDCQLENLVVHGEQPVLVDLETLFHPHVRPETREGRTETSTVVSNSILLTGLLPWLVRRREDPDVSHLDASGQAGEQAYKAGFGAGSDPVESSRNQAVTFRAVNTDVMAVTFKPVKVARKTNTPRLDGQDLPPAGFVDSLLRGFRETYLTIMELHSSGRFTTEIVTPELVSGVENRMVYRATSRYSSVLHSMAAREQLRDGISQTRAIEEFAVPFFDGQIPPEEYWPLYAAEAKSLLRRDVPRFTSTLDGKSISWDGTPVGVEVDAAGYERTRQRLDAMGEADLERQQWLLRHCFDAEEPGPPQMSEDRSIQLTDELLERTATEAFDRAWAEAIEVPPGVPSWVSFTPLREPRALSLRPAYSSVHGGNGGIALAAAALFRATDDPEYRTIAREILEPVVEELDDGGAVRSLGGTTGVGSLVYTLTVCGELLDESYHSLALDAAKAVTPELTEEDDVFDVVGGAAGTILALLACYERTGESALLDRAITCGQHLLDSRVEYDGVRVWETTTDRPYTGFSHGVSGIAYALVRLGKAVDQPRFVDGGLEALAYEDERYDPAYRNWPDYRVQDGERFVDMWCHGRTGIALSRLAIGELLDDSDRLSEARRAIDATRENEPLTCDHVCCGSFGRVELLLEATRRIDYDPDAPFRLAERRLARRQETGTFSFVGHSGAVVEPTFFGGLAGVSYSLLRLRDPEQFPCVALLE